MTGLPNCPSCGSEYTYEDRDNVVCSLCAHEWNPNDVQAVKDVEEVINDANGNPLTDGDTVIVIKDLKVKGSSTAVKKGTKIKGIRLIHNAKDGHDIDCKITGFGSMMLKSEFVKKA